jgi:twitching motility protein PilT
MSQSASLVALIADARAAQASDLHLEAGLSPCLRVRGQLRDLGPPIGAQALLEMARATAGETRWAELQERRSCDLSRTLGGARCRINIFCTSRGVGMAIRFLASFQASLSHLNLHPEFARLIQPDHGLVIVSGATGSGKSTTLAALIHELNGRERRHIVTLESPIEYTFAPRHCFIRQREVGRDTPSFAQGLYDAMREDPDVLVVGELRDPETMRLTLNAAETGHLVLTTLHSSSAAEALQRIASAFPAELQSSVCAQLADTLVGVVCQRMRAVPGRNQIAPECELLMATQPAKAYLRQGAFSKLQTALETGGAEGCFTFSRYREWMEKKTDWSTPPAQADAREEGPAAEAPSPAAKRAARVAPASRQRDDGVLEIGSADDDLARILSELEKDG